MKTVHTLLICILITLVLGLYMADLRHQCIGLLARYIRDSPSPNSDSSHESISHSNTRGWIVLEGVLSHSDDKSKNPFLVVKTQTYQSSYKNEYQNSKKSYLTESDPDNVSLITSPKMKLKIKSGSRANRSSNHKPFVFDNSFEAIWDKVDTRFYESTEKIKPGLSDDLIKEYGPMFLSLGIENPIPTYYYTELTSVVENNKSHLIYGYEYEDRIGIFLISSVENRALFLRTLIEEFYSKNYLVLLFGSNVILCIYLSYRLHMEKLIN